MLLAEVFTGLKAGVLLPTRAQTALVTNMKRFKVTITAEFALPDDYELSPEPEDDQVNPRFLCLRRGTKYYHPIIHWMQHHYYIDAALHNRFESVPGSGWEQADEHVAEQFTNAIVLKGNCPTEDYRIEQL